MLDKNSVFYTYKELIDLRKKYAIFTDGIFELIDSDNEEIFAYKRVLDDQLLIVVSNFTHNQTSFDVGIDLLNEYKVLASNYSRNEVSCYLELKPYESLMILTTFRK